MPTVPMSGTANSTFQSDVPSRSGTTSVALAELLSKVESLAPKSKGLPSSPGHAEANTVRMGGNRRARFGAQFEGIWGRPS